MKFVGSYLVLVTDGFCARARISSKMGTLPLR